MLAASCVAAAVVLSSPTSSADPTSAHPCDSGEVTVSAGPPQAAVTHRAVTLTFSLVPGAGACTLTGYPGVDSGRGGPLLHAQSTLRGYLGGLAAGIDQARSITVSTRANAYAVVEGRAIDAAGNQCPTYTDLQVTAPDTTESFIVLATIDTCELEVHPVTT